MTRPNLNAVAKVPTEMAGAICSTGFDVLRSIEVEPDWLFLIVKSRPFVDTMTALVQGALYPAVRPADIRAYEFPLPPLAEQRRIVAKIEALQERSRRAREVLSEVGPLLEQFRQSVLAAAFRGDLTADWRAAHPHVEPASVLLQRIRAERRHRWEHAELAKYAAKGQKPPKNWQEKYKEPDSVDDSDLPELPEGWCWTSLGHLAWSVKDGPHVSPKYSETGIPFISGRNVRPEGIDFSTAKYIAPALHGTLSQRCKPEKGDVLYTKGGTTGIARVNTYDIEFNVWVHVAVLKLVPNVLPFYVQHMLNSPHCYAQSQRLTHGVGNQDLGLTRMVNITMPIMPREEQELIIERIDASMRAVEQIVQEVGSAFIDLGILDQSILAKAFRGELVPQDPNDEPASVLLERIRVHRAHRAEAAKGQKKTAKMQRTNALTKPASGLASQHQAPSQVLTAKGQPISPEQLQLEY